MGVALASIFAIAENGLGEILDPVDLIAKGCDDSGACKDSGIAAGCSRSEGSPYRTCGCATNPDGVLGRDLYECKGNGTAD